MWDPVSVSLLVAILVVPVPHSEGRCDRTPDANPNPKTPLTDGRFYIQISGSPESYVPGEQYTVFLRGIVNNVMQHKFREFFLVAEQEAADPMREPFQKPSVGSFTLYGDTLTKFSEKCPNSVIQTNSLPKTEIQVLWKAPPSGSGCVAFRATVLEHKDQWFMDDGDLAKILCEEMTESDDIQPPVLNRCCACDEAKYEVTFEGLWSRNTHPKDFPSNGWLTRFSDVIGASHTKNYTFWNYGEFASEGLRQVAEKGNTRMLESELKAKSNHIRTIIKARGISFPNVTGKTFAVFRVDNRHHLMSLVSMIDPSPDWFVGVSSLELCLRNCSWIESKILNLYPWDAGTDDGWTYISPDQQTVPRNTIRRIKSNSPNDPRSPFYDATGVEMKPLARLYLSRQRLYEKTCDPSIMETSGEVETYGSERDCRVTEWSEWSPCTATCGKGTKYRQRAYLDENSKFVCNKQLTGRSTCWGPQRHCPDHSEDILHDPMCALTDWSEWSSCSVTCGRGTKTRDRRYQTRNATKHCVVGLANPPRLKQSEVCYGIYGSCDGKPLDTDSDNYDMMGFDMGENHDVIVAGITENITRDCPYRRWSEWSPCSVTCGQGYKHRFRAPVIERYEDSVEENSANEEDDRDDDDPCEDERTKEVVGCTAEIPTCEISSSTIDEVCSMPKDIGPCRANIERWYFDTVRASCEVFSYTGCQGNRNNFESKKRCEKLCGDFKITTEVLGGLQPGSLILDKRPFDEDSITHETMGPVVDCQVTRWSRWTSCNITTSCGRGYKQKHRQIKIHPMNGGKPCPRKLLKIKKCKVSCTDSKDNFHNSLSATWGPPSIPNGLKVDCIMSKWSPWSPCSHTCGPNAIQQRTRRILVFTSGGGRPCMHRIDTRPCNVAPCTLNTH